jgi:hemerythrin superfamily protein
MPKEQDAITLLKTDHATVKKLFEQEEKLKKRDSEKQASTFSQIKDALEVHATIEEEIFYPVVKKARSEHVKDEVREAYEEHKQIKTLLAEIASITPGDETYDMKMKVLKEDVEHHVKGGGRRDVSRRQEIPWREPATGTGYGTSSTQAAARG